MLTSDFLFSQCYSRQNLSLLSEVPEVPMLNETIQSAEQKLSTSPPYTFFSIFYVFLVGIIIFTMFFSSFYRFYQIFCFGLILKDSSFFTEMSSTISISPDSLLYVVKAPPHVVVRQYLQPQSPSYCQRTITWQHLLWSQSDGYFVSLSLIRKTFIDFLILKDF